MGPKKDNKPSKNGSEDSPAPSEKTPPPTPGTAKDGTQNASTEDTAIANLKSQGGGSAAVLAGSGVSQLSQLLGKTVLVAPQNNGSATAKGESSKGGEGKGDGKRDSAAAGLANVGEPPRKKRTPALNAKTAKALIQEEMSKMESKLTAQVSATVRQVMGEHVNMLKSMLAEDPIPKVTADAFKSALGLGPTETFAEAISQLYGEAAKTAAAEVLKKGAAQANQAPTSFSPGFDFVGAAKWSNLELTLNSLERVLKSKADETMLRGGKEHAV